MILDKLFVPSKTDSEKIQSLDSCIENCLKMIRQDLEKRKVFNTGWASQVNYMMSINDILDNLKDLKDDFEILINHRDS
jgi:hypothetical protein